MTPEVKRLSEVIFEGYHSEAKNQTIKSSPISDRMAERIVKDKGYAYELCEAMARAIEPDIPDDVEVVGFAMRRKPINLAEAFLDELLKIVIEGAKK